MNKLTNQSNSTQDTEDQKQWWAEQTLRNFLAKRAERELKAKAQQ